MPLATSTANMAALTIRAIQRIRPYPGSTEGAGGGRHEPDIGFAWTRRCHIYEINSSARNSNPCGTFSPRARAVLRLMMKS